MLFFTSLVLYGIGFSTAQLPYGHPRQDTNSYLSYPNFTLWLVEEFEEPLDLDTDPIWTWSDGGLSEGQVRFVKEAIKFEDGKMVLEASSGAPVPQSCSHAEVGIVSEKALTSGEMRTRHNLFRYGFYEVRMKAPKVQPNNVEVNGNYVSTMFAYRDAKFVHWREIDIEVTGDAVNSITMNVLNAENTAAWNPWIQASQHHAAQGVNVRQEFNTYAFEWLPSGITWYFNGQEVGHHGTDKDLSVPDMSTKIMMNLWIFGSSYAFGGPDGQNNQYPLRSEYDWFRFYRWDGDASYPCADMTTSCLSEDDKYLSGNNPCDGVQQSGTVYGSPPCEGTCASSRSADLTAEAATSQDIATTGTEMTEDAYEGDRHHRQEDIVFP